MQRLGTVLHTSSQMNIVVKSNFIPKIGKRNIVINKNKTKIGYVYDIIGSINRPYVLVKPFSKNKKFSYLNGELLYIRQKRYKFKKK